MIFIHILSVTHSTKARIKDEKQTNRRMPHPRTMLQRETWALWTFHPWHQMIKPESQESLACPVRDDASVSLNRTQKCELSFCEWYWRRSPPSEPRSEAHWVMFNLSSFRAWLRQDVQRSHVTYYTAIMQWSVIRQSSQTFLPNSHRPGWILQRKTFSVLSFQLFAKKLL